jgi:hypothetical protein
MLRANAVLCAIFLTLLALQSSAEIATPPNYPISSPSPEIQNEEMIWVDPTDSTLLIADWRDFRLGYRRLGIGRSTDGGNTWVDSLVSVMLYQRQSDPTMDVDRHGNFYLSMLDYQASGVDDRSAISFLRTTDKGVSWSQPVAIEGPPYVYFEDKQFMTIDRTGGTYDGNLYVGWARFPNDDSPNIIMFARSTDFDQGFETPIAIGPPWDTCGSTIWGGQFTQPIVGSDGSVYVFWVGTGVDSLCNFYYTIYMVKSTDGGQTFTEKRAIQRTAGNYNLIDGAIDVYNAPICAADINGGSYDGNIYVSYANMDITNTDYYDFNIEFIRSTDGGETWSEPYYINDDFTGPGAMFDQFHPWLFCNQDGVLIIIFYDQRTDPVSHYFFDVFAAYSFNGGQSFTRNHRISDTSVVPGYLKTDYNNPVAMSIRGGPKNGLVPSKAGRIAEYIGVTAFHDHVNAVWTDTRRFSQDVFGANWIIPVLAPHLIYPVNGDSVSDYTEFDWDISWKMDDDLYRIEISKDEFFNSIVFSQTLDSAGYGITPDFLAYGPHYWRVIAFKISTGDSSDYSETGEFFITSFICADVNADGSTDMLDILGLISYLYKSGSAPYPLQSGNVNNDGKIDMLDILYLIDYLYKGGPEPTCP